MHEKIHKFATKYCFENLNSNFCKKNSVIESVVFSEQTYVQKGGWIFNYTEKYLTPRIQEDQLYPISSGTRY